jgi:glycylpeptide N-tetradecanoyltransferase
VNTVEINFLCVLKKLRSKRLAPALIKEVTRRVNLQGIFQAVYTAGIYLPRPIAKCRYYHRTISAKKAVECGFSYLHPDQTMASYIAQMKIPAKRELNWETLSIEDCAEAMDLLSSKFHATKAAVFPVFNLEEFTHYFITRKNAIYSYIVKV